MKDLSSDPEGLDKNAKMTLPQYLKSTEVKPLVFIGKSMEFWGTGIVVAFILGIATVYSWAAFRGAPPYFPAKSSGVEMVKLTGSVTTLDNKPLDGYQIGVIDMQTVNAKDGTFSIRVPLTRKGSYDLVAWVPGYYPVKVWGNQTAHKSDGTAYILDKPLENFPSHLGTVSGKVLHLDRRPASGLVEIGGESAVIEPDGTFVLNNIPLGKATLHVRPSPTANPNHTQDITMQLLTPTTVDVTISP